MKIKNMVMFGLILVSILAVSGLSYAMPAVIDYVELDDDMIAASGINLVRSLDKGDEFEVKVHVTALEDMDDVQIEAYIRGYDHDDSIEDITNVFDMKAGSYTVKKLNLKFPKRMEQDEYKLRVEVADRNGDTLVETFDLTIETGRHDVAIKDVDLSPGNGVIAGRALLATVRLQNYGAGDEDDVKVKFSIPELGVTASDYIDELEADGGDDDQKSTEELYLRIPSCTEAGVYDAEVEVTYHDGDKTVRKEMSVEVFADGTCELSGVTEEDTTTKESGKTVISIGPDSQDVTIGAGGVIYPVTITNAGSSSKTYIVNVKGGDWGTFRVSPSNVVTVGKDETKSVYVYASANENAPAGEQIFGVEIMSGDKSLKEVTLKANVVGNSGLGVSSFKRALEIGLIVLVVILVILGLIIGFNKLKGDDEDKEEGQSYY